jgi:cysteine desulfurase
MIYLDNNATTQPSPRVVEAMLPYLNECYFNPSSSTAAFTGADAPRRAAAGAIAKLVNAEEPDCFSFTSGATESNNWIFSSITKSFKTGTVLISAVEHASVSEPAIELARRGFKVIEIPVDQRGLLHLDALHDALGEETVLVSIMAANNETGVLQPLPEIGSIIRKRSPAALFHTDATQAIGKVKVDLQGDWPDVDLASFSAHKFHGPKGIGGLYIRPGIELLPLLLGGGQEEGRRSGTLNTPGLAGLAVAATDWNPVSTESIANLRDQLELELKTHFPGAQIHSAGVRRLPNTSCFSLTGAVGEELAATLATQGIIVGTGSACASGAMRPPKTLLAMNVDYEVARAALRVSLSAATNIEQVREFLRQLADALSTQSMLKRVQAVHRS